MMPPMTPGLLAFVAFRVATALPVLRWPLAGGLLAIAGDLADLLLRDLLGIGGAVEYQVLDKLIDQVYLALFLVVALRWEGVERRIAVALYLYRLAGSILFLVTGDRAVLLLFPNVFEPWFIFVAAIHHLPAPLRWTPARLAVVLTVADRAQAGAGVGAPRRPDLRFDDLAGVPRGALAQADGRALSTPAAFPGCPPRGTLSPPWTGSASSTSRTRRPSASSRRAPTRRSTTAPATTGRTPTGGRRRTGRAGCGPATGAGLGGDHPGAAAADEPVPRRSRGPGRQPVRPEARGTGQPVRPRRRRGPARREPVRAHARSAPDRGPRRGTEARPARARAGGLRELREGAARRRRGRGRRTPGGLCPVRPPLRVPARPAPPRPVPAASPGAPPRRSSRAWRWRRISRGRGFGAARWCAAICDDLAGRGFAAVEAYPEIGPAPDATSAATPAFWERAGFAVVVPDERYPVVRREL